jgi:hypothetical protein
VEPQYEQGLWNGPTTGTGEQISSSYETLDVRLRSPLPPQTFSLWRFRRALNMSFSLREKVAEGRMRGG